MNEGLLLGGSDGERDGACEMVGKNDGGIEGGGDGDAEKLGPMLGAKLLVGAPVGSTVELAIIPELFSVPNEL